MRKFLTPQMLIVLLMGFASGLPLALTGGTLQAWMRSEGVDLSTIGLFSLVGIPYALKFLWAPLMDRYSWGKLGRRRSWMLVTQVLLVFFIMAMGWTDPKSNLTMLALLSLAVSFFSASQDIVIDAWRREALREDELGFASSVHVNGYLFAFRMVAGALALVLSDHLPWSQVYLIMGLFMGLGLVATFFAKEPQVATTPRTLKESVVDPFIDYFSRPGAVWILVFILLYKLGDNMALQMTTPLYIDLGYTRSEIGAISKLVGWICLAAGGLIGGALIYRIKLIPSLVLFGIFQGIATMGFAVLSRLPKDLTALSVVIGLDNFAIGMGTSAFIAFMALLTNKKFTATQYALLTSFMGIPSKVIPATAGWLAESMGYFGFFTFCSFLCLPGVVMIYWLRKFEQISSHNQ
jgi:PAT family beta-lactamase induction signal transducer AmpG